MDNSTTVKIGKKAFISSALILLALMILSGVLTRLIPSGSYERVLDSGKESILPNSFQYVDKIKLPVYRWFTSPVEVLFSSDALVIITIIIFLMIIGGAFSVINKANVLKLIINSIVYKFKEKRYLLIWIIVFVFMTFGSILGMFEEIIVLIPVVISLSYSLGWDSLMGLGMSILATCFGFSAAISNPFTLGIAQKLAGLPIFSGALFRIVFFIVTYVILSLFLVNYAKKIEKDPKKSLVYGEENIYKNNLSDDISKEKTKGEKRAVNFFIFMVCFIVISIISLSFIGNLSDYSMVVVGILFLITGIFTGLLSDIKNSEIFKSFLAGIMGILPGIILILMAMSIKYIISSGGIMDTILYNTSNFISQTNKVFASYIMYALVLIMNFFIGSASAKAFLVIPIISPLSDIVGLTRQTAVQAFAFGDGFSNILYPTNAVLLISLGVASVSYTKWFKFVIKLQIFVLFISTIFLTIASLINYGPF
ncbi:MAG: YfcC family protein [Clostridiaceae bacterium]